MDSLELEKIWKATLNELEVELGKNNFGLYLKNSALISLENEIAKIGFPNKGVATQTNARYYSLIQNALQKNAKTEKLSLVFEVVTDLAPKKEVEEEIGPLFSQPKEEAAGLLERVKRSHLRPDFTFEDFCVSTSNQLAFAAATAVAKTPGKNYNPFFIWGGVGVGKTHLMQAVGHEILRSKPNARIVYAPGEQFTNEIIEGIRNKNTKDFKDKYRKADALLIDDIQFLSGKDTAQEEFFHTFNAIQQNEGQIVMTSDRKPSDIPDLADRLKSRFEGGMVADISTPDSELKTAICQLKAKKRGLTISNEIAFVITNNVDNIRSLEGALQKIAIYLQNNSQELTADMVIKLLALPETSIQRPVSRLDARTVLEQVCAYYDLPMKLIKGEKRDKPIVTARQILMYLLHKDAHMTYEDVADFIGGRDHTTIMHGFKKIEFLLLNDQQIQKEIADLEKCISSG